MTEQAEPGDVGRRVHADLEHGLARRAVERRHQLDGRADGAQRVDVLLGRRRDDAHAQGLGEHEIVAGLAAARLRALLARPDMVVAPGAYDAITARLIEQAGFPAVYMTGAGTSAV